MPGFFTLLSGIGILIGVVMIMMGFNGHGMTPFFVTAIGFFVTLKEIMDIIVAGK